MRKDIPPSRLAEQFVVRFPNGMRDRIADEAKANGRSMNAEIVHRLQASFDAPNQAPINDGAEGIVRALGVLPDTQGHQAKKDEISTYIEDEVSRQTKATIASLLEIAALAKERPEIIQQLTKIDSFSKRG